MTNKHKLWGVVGLLAAMVVAAGLYLRHKNVSVLMPAGPIAQQERQLILLAAGLMLLVVLPVLGLTFWITWRYRESQKATYSPEFDHSRLAETTWWAIPSILIIALAVITWQATHALDPFRPLASSTKPLTIQVIALDWRWLFIYPAQHVASMNQVVLPVGRPVHFDITADAPMNSFWIPSLGGQIYAMPGMSTSLQLQADKLGTYRGSSANLSGSGFAGMDFSATAVSSKDFSSWLRKTGRSASQLDIATYTALAAPKSDASVMTFSKADSNLYNQVVMKYMMPGHTLGASL